MHIRFGNNVSFSYQHTRRHFKPNTHSKWLPSALLEGNGVRATVTTRALRTIHKQGGLDQFLLAHKFANESAFSRDLRKRAMEALALNPSLPRPAVNTRRPRLPKSMVAN